MKGSFDRQKSLQELEQDNWGEPPYNSYLVTTIHRLRRKPLAEFATEDLRIMIGQRIGLPTWSWDASGHSAETGRR